MERIWLNHYPKGVPATIDASRYSSLVSMLDEGFARHAGLPAYKFMGRSFSFREIDDLSRAFAAYLQAQGLAKGDRVAVMMPNVPQYPVAVAGILRAGLVLVNVNPLYTPRELEHQLRDSGAKGLVILENFAHVLQKCSGAVAPRTIVLASLGDMLGALKGTIVNLVVRHVKKMVPAHSLPGAVRFNDAIANGRRSPFVAPEVMPDDIALLQYTGGTTGVSKGAMLLHRNVVANVLQSEAWHKPAFAAVASSAGPPSGQSVGASVGASMGASVGSSAAPSLASLASPSLVSPELASPALASPPASDQTHFVCALPLYHIFAFTVNMMLGLREGNCNILIPNPRDVTAMLKELRQHRVHSFPAVNTLFNAVANHPDFATVDWSHLRLSVGGGMAVQRATAKLWLEKTGCAICEGYGLTETSPSVACNPTDSKSFTATIGMPLPSTDIKLIDEAGDEVAPGANGEIAISGPQVMGGYWQRPEETAAAMTADGYFRTGDIGAVDERGYFRIVDRKKDMILVSGFNVYPNEIEDVVSEMPGVKECAVVGMPDEKTGEAVRLVVVKRDPALTDGAVREFCALNLTGYKRPKVIEFRTELPKTPVGKILRRALRDAA